MPKKPATAARSDNSGKAPASVAEAQHAAFMAYHRSSEGAALSHLRERFVPIDGQPAAVERWYDEGPRVMIVPSEIEPRAIDAAGVRRLAQVIAKLGEGDTLRRLVRAGGDPKALAKVATRIGLDVDDLALLVALTSSAAAVGVIAQAALCGRSCPFCHGLLCLGTGTCGKTTPHTGVHKCNLNHTWR